MSPISRRSMITTAAGGLLTATAAKAQTGEETAAPPSWSWRQRPRSAQPNARPTKSQHSCPALD
jgi:hypothetical protein